MSDAEVANDTVFIGYHVILFVDVLGQKEHLKRWERLPTNAEEKVEFIKALKDTAGRVDFVRQMVLRYFNSFLKAPTQVPLSELLTEDQIKIFYAMRDCRIEIQQFSDTVLAFSPLVNSATGTMMVRGAYALLAAACSTMLTSLAAGVPIRGAIDVGVAMELGPRDIYGPGLLAVYKLEQEVAQYPRIVVGDGLRRFLADVSNDPQTDALSLLSKQMAAICGQFLSQDENGVMFLDFLGKQFLEIIGELERPDLSTKCRQFVTTEYERFSKTGDQKHSHRYGLLKQYIDMRFHETWKEQL